MTKWVFILLLPITLITTACNDTDYRANSSKENADKTEFPMSIDGKGFFILRDEGSNDLKYTKLGDFYLSFKDEEYSLVDSNGNYVQGWETEIDGDITGSTRDITFFSESIPEPSHEIIMLVNLDAEEPVYQGILSSDWDGTAVPPISSSAYNYSTTVEVYDIEGLTHNINIYYRKISSSEWSYIITCNPDEDFRTDLSNTEVSGLLADGRLYFNESSGSITGITMRRLTGYTPSASAIDQAVEDTGTGTYRGFYNITTNRPETLSSPGSSTLNLTYSGASNSWTCNSLAYPDAEILLSSESKIKIDLDDNTSTDITIDIASGVSLTNDDTIDLILKGSEDWEIQTASDFNSNGYFEFKTDFGGIFINNTRTIAFNPGIIWNGNNFVTNLLSSTQYASSFSVISQSADGYGIEDFVSASVNKYGVITGHFTNELNIPIFRISLAKFNAPYWLHDEGDSYYSATNDSGQATISLPGTNGLGSIVPDEITDDPTFTGELFSIIEINGQGFFEVRAPGSGDLFYTQHGEFYFNKDGCLTTPDGYIAQGWTTDSDGRITGSTTDIAISSYHSQPQATESISVITTLDKDSVSNTAILSSAWDGKASTPISSSAYEYKSTLKAYDSLGSTHDITIYYDKISDLEWEYIVTCNPEEDLRSGFAGTASQGLLARGKLVFDEVSGAITSTSMTNLTSHTASSAGTNQSVLCTAAGGALSTFNATITVNNAEALTNVNDGSLILTFYGSNWILDGASPVGGTIIADTETQVSVRLPGSTTGADITIYLSQTAVNGDSLTITLKGSNDWTPLDSSDFNPGGYFEFFADFIGGTSTSEDIAFDTGIRWNGTSFVPGSLTTTQYASSSTTVYQSADGYGASDLEHIDVDVEGLITGEYSNDQLFPLYRIAVANFDNPDGLHVYEGNIYEATSLSGSPFTNLACMDGINCITVLE